MSYFRVSEMRSRARSETQLTYDTAGGMLSRSMGRTGPFDLFLSHSSLDAEIVLGVKKELESTGASVYVDWVDDPQLDRTRVTAATARQLRSRMDQCRSLIFATSPSSPNSKWMPWELGYFDGTRGEDAIAIMPLVTSSDAEFLGQEYLGLYPKVEKLRGYGMTGEEPTVARRPYGSRLEIKRVPDLARPGSTFSVR